MPTTSFVAPQPGDLITSEFLGQVITAIGGLEDLVTNLSSRVSALEHPPGRGKWPPPGLVIQYPPDKIGPVQTAMQQAITQLPADASDQQKFLAAYEVYTKSRADLLSGMVTGDPGDPTPEEMLNVAIMAGLSASAGYNAVKSVDQVAAARIDGLLSEHNTTLLGVQATFDRLKIGGLTAHPS